MKANVIEEKQNPLLKRKDLIVSVDYEGKSTASRAELQKLLADQLNANIENLEISKILSETGQTRGKAWVKIWDEKKVEVYSQKKKEGEEEKAEPEKPEEIKETKSEEKPTEEKAKEEKEIKAEEKKEAKTEEKPTEEKKEEKKEPVKEEKKEDE